MRAPRRRRERVRKILPEAERPDPTFTEQVRYVGSPEHKRQPSFAGMPRPRADASICDPRFNDRQAELTDRLREALSRGAVGGPIEGDYPRYVWCLIDEEVYEGRLVNQNSGEYKGYLLKRDEWPDGLDAFR
jgi:hypothetical protein